MNNLVINYFKQSNAKIHRISVVQDTEESKNMLKEISIHEVKKRAKKRN